MTRPRLAVLVSGGGTTLENFAARIADGRLDAEIVGVVASKHGIGALARCARLGLPVTVVPWPGKAAAAEFDDAVTRAVESTGADLVCMGGFLRLWRFPERWSGRVLNIHPGLLPRFGGPGMYGHHVHAAVLAAGVPESGCTVHVATHAYDQGPVVVERRVPVQPGDTADTLAARVFAAECEAYPEAIELYGAGRVEIADGTVRVRPADGTPS